jgi:hypothetical protein
MDVALSSRWAPRRIFVESAQVNPRPVYGTALSRRADERRPCLPTNLPAGQLSAPRLQEAVLTAKIWRAASWAWCAPTWRRGGVARTCGLISMTRSTRSSSSASAMAGFCRPPGLAECPAFAPCRWENRPARAVGPLPEMAATDESRSRMFERTWAQAIMAEAAPLQRRLARKSGSEAVTGYLAGGPPHGARGRRRRHRKIQSIQPSRECRAIYEIPWVFRVPGQIYDEEIRVTVQVQSTSVAYARIRVSGTINLVNPIERHPPGTNPPLPFSAQISLTPLR